MCISCLSGYLDSMGFVGHPVPCAVHVHTHSPLTRIVVACQCITVCEQGVPLRVELGPRDLEKNQVSVVRRDTGEKMFFAIDTAVNRLKVRER